MRIGDRRGDPGSEHGGDPVGAAEAALAADRAHADPALWTLRVPEDAVRARARTLAAEGPRGRALWGVPFAVKDNIDVAGLPTTAACPDYAYVPERHAPAVARLLDAGAILLGKTNLDQFATGLVGTRSPYGTPRNVFDGARVPGGSSSGSAAAVAAGIVPVALGTDTAGSGRVPAMFGHIAGLKPTLGAIPTAGVVPACRSLDTVSVFARTTDAALDVLRVAAGYAPEDPYSRVAPPGYARRGALPPEPRLAIADAAALCHPCVAAAYGRAARLFGAATVDIAPLLEVARLLYAGPWVAERTSALRAFLTAHPDSVHPVTRGILRGGMDRLAVDAFDAFHVLAQARRHAADLFRSHDALLLPTAPFCPTLAEDAGDPIGHNARLGTFTNFANLCDLAAIAVPAGFDADGLPVGVMVIGPAWSEFRIGAIADALHRALAPSAGAARAPLPPQTEPSALAADETALFCVGAHMSGLPLNHQLTALGARFLQPARTAPFYRLHALGDRPGLVRVGAGEGGGAVAGEVWALPTAAIGVLLASVPAPLGFGTVALEDGDMLGFLAEAHALADAPDITPLGGWRAWVDRRR